MRNYKYLKAVVIVHGKSEKQICEFIKQELRLKMEIKSRKKGENSIQITSLKNTLNNKIFKTKSSFLKEYEDIEMDEKGKNISPNFKIFIIMDTDDCEEKQKQDFINKKMFEGYWAYDYIVPIYNIPKLEDILAKAGIPFEKEGDKRKEEYIKIFPTDKKYKKNQCIQIEEFANNLSKVKDTNMEEFVKFCLESAE